MAAFCIVSGGRLPRRDARLSQCRLRTYRGRCSDRTRLCSGEYPAADCSKPAFAAEDRPVVVDLQKRVAVLLKQCWKVACRWSKWILLCIVLGIGVVLRSARTYASVAAETAEIVAPAPSTPLNATTIGLFALLFLVAAALAAAETAITTMWPWKVRQIASAEGDSSVFFVLQQDVTRFLTTILIATTVSTIFTTALATEVASVMFSSKAGVAYVTGGLTLFFLFFGEILPKSLAVHNAEGVLRFMLPSINWLSIVLYPVGKILTFSAKTILELIGINSEEDAPVTEQELRLMIAGADRSGALEPYESKLISNVLDLQEIDVKNVMCPRVDVVSLDLSATLRDFVELEKEYHFSRVPIFKDTVDNIVGVMYAKSILRYLSSPGKLDEITVMEVAETPYFVPETLSAWHVLEQMRSRRLHMAIVVDEYGGTAGLVTLEDILEEVVGEIYDEDDDYDSDSTALIYKPDGSYTIDGQTELEKVSEVLPLAISDDDLADHGTISGFLCDRMGGIPVPGDKIEVNGVTFTVTEAGDRRIKSLQAFVNGERPSSAESASPLPPPLHG
eukprot:Plantae.Rhodophyta-Purpureofilum_apyrenoidigerum.ctg15567.p1 GENE.Plantae.Rhodophyta-Purpureofilum_apyrenoidigerum.ctg15567~~Plantae.Rhodophyta-Purpureofilum_apyrenoidigerum.ctg15567.p1  ORF type:complete len:561 (+),score=102.60 Plantae.Rhodophyta-Purpureofilum_apyrenoidigerum.ctg15567:88-1770(+)